MQLEQRRRRPAVIGLTSLIDVIFLLLLFFMLTSTFLKYAPMDLGVAAGGTNGRGHPKLIVRVTDADGVAFNGRTVTWDDLQPAIGDFMDKGVERAVVVPRGDNVDVQTLVTALERLRKTELKSVTLAH